MLTDNLFSQVALLFAVGERQKYKNIVKALPQLIEDSKFDEIEKLLVSCGSFQVASNFSDLVHFFRVSRDRISKIVEVGTFNFASSTLVNCLKRENAFFYGFDNWELGGARARALAEWRSGFFPNSYVLSGHPLSSTLSASRLKDADMLLIDGNHSFQSTLADCACLEFLKDGAAVFFHDCGLGNRIWGCFWVYYLMQEYGIVEPYDGRFDNRISAVDARRKPLVDQGEKPEIEFAIGIFRQDNYVRLRYLLQNPQLLWDEVRDRFNMHKGLGMTSQSYVWDEWFC